MQEEIIQAAAGWPVLNTVELRVLACLMEKAMATPDLYPLTLNSLTNACNQKSNRDPVLSLTEAEVIHGLDSLRHTHHLAALVHTAGSRTEKFRHTISQVITLNPEQAAVLCELMLRGPQTVGELRTRASRLNSLDSLEQVQQILDDLAQHPGGPVVARLPREPGRRENRWAHCLSGAIDSAAPEPQHATPLSTATSDVQQQIDDLKAELAALKEELATFRRQFD